MNSKDIKYLFRNYYRYKQLIENQKEKLQQIRTQAEKITPSYSENSGGGGSGNKSKVEENAIKICEVENSIKKLEMLVNTAEEYLKRLKAHQRHLIISVLMDGNTYEYVAYQEDTSPENIRKMIKSALRYLEQF